MIFLLIHTLLQNNYILFSRTNQQKSTLTKENAIKRSTVVTKDAPAGKTAPNGTEDDDKFGTDLLTSGEGGNCKELSLG